MDAALGRQADALTFLRAVEVEPYRFDFYQTMRRLECLYATQPRWGCATRPAQEPLRLGQAPDLSFAPASLAALHMRAEGAPRLQVLLFGLLGPNGPLPIHITDYARERQRLHGDPTLGRFLDLLNHRFLALFYRAWAQAQPHVSRDRPGDDRFAAFVGALIGVAPEAFRNRDTVPDLSRLFHAGSLVRQVRNPDGLVAIVTHAFRVPASIQEFVGQWLRLSPNERTSLGGRQAVLGTQAVAGSRVWDRQSKFRLRLGPLTLAEYEAFLPLPSARRAHPVDESQTARSRTTSRVPSMRLQRLVDWVRFYLCYELDWDVQLVLRKEEVPGLRLGGGSRLGWTTWLGRRQEHADAEDLCLNAEAFVTRATGQAA